MNTAIYYPRLYPPAKWLRIAALCWDTVYTIVPQDAPEAPEEVATLDRTLGGFLETLPFDGPLGSRDLIDAFVAWVDAHAGRFELEPLVETGEGFTSDVAYLYPGKLGGIDAPIVDDLIRRGLARVEQKRTVVDVAEWEAEREPVGEGVVAEPEPRPGTPHAEYETLLSAWRATRDRVERKRLFAQAIAFRDEHLVPIEKLTPLLLVSNELALHYLALCASYLAERERRDLATASGRFTDVIVTGSRAAAAADVAQAVIEAHVPVNIEEVEVERLAELRQTLRQERHRFQRDVDELVAEFDAIASAGELEKLRDDMVELANARIDATRRAHRHANLELGVEVMGISLAPPALAATTASLLGVGIFGPVGIATALGLGAIKAYLAWRDGDEKRHGAQWSYVLALRDAAAG